MARAFSARHLRAVEPAVSGAYGEGPVCRMGVTFGVSIVRTACSYSALLSSGSHPRPDPSLDARGQATTACPASVSTLRSALRELMSSFSNTLRRWYSTVRGLMNSWAPISGLVCPSPAR